MGRVVRIVMLAVVLGQAAGLFWLAGDGCTSECEDDADAEGEDCPPVCPTCACSLRPPTSLTASASPQLAALSPTRCPRAAECDRAPGSPDPREILHVPRVLPA